MVLFSVFPSWISPYVIEGLPIRWYAVMYIVAFILSYALFRHFSKQESDLKLTAEQTQDFYFWVIIGLLIGARVGSCLFYSDASYYLTHPWMMFWPFRDGQFVGLPGMSYHIAVVGVTVATCIYCRKHRLSILKMGDLLALSVPLAYFFGRLGNFINGELYGRVTTSAVGMIFPTAEMFPVSIPWVREIADKLALEYVEGGYVNLPRFPSQLFEAFGEGLLLFALMYFLIWRNRKKRNIPDGMLISSYIFGYGLVRFIIEYFRQPDAEIGYVLTFGRESDNIYLFESVFNISKGQVFCLIMMVIGIVLAIAVTVWRNKRVEYDKQKNRKPKK